MADSCKGLNSNRNLIEKRSSSEDAITTEVDGNCNIQKIIQGLFVTFEGLSPTIADSQVITHIRDMRKAGINIELWAFAPKKDIYAFSLPRLSELNSSYEGKVCLFKGVPPTVPFSELLNAGLLWWYLYKYNIKVSFVHARTDYAAVVCGIVRLFRKFSLIWDCRGDTEAEYVSRYSQTTFLRRLAKPIQILILRLRIILASRLCDKAIFVSRKLQEKRISRSFNNKLSTVIPSVASKEIFFFSRELREIYRRKIGIAKDDKVIIYSGSMGGYQIFDKCVKLFKQLSDRDDKLKFLVLTPYMKLASVFLAELPAEKYWLTSSTLAEANGYLNAADYGMFLRDRDPLNLVASPVKFAEYCMAGLPIIMTDSVEQSLNISRELGNGIYYNFEDYAPSIVCYNENQRQIISDRASNILSRETVVNEFIDLYIGRSEL